MKARKQPHNAGNTIHTTTSGFLTRKRAPALAYEKDEGMIKSAVNAIKQERKLSFNNWRYQLLHWAAGINPATPQESILPAFLYTHYCPLFHYTNLLVLAFPFILMWKMARIAVTVVVFGIVIPIYERIDRVFNTISTWRKARKAARQQTTTDKPSASSALNYKKRRERALAVRLINRYRHVMTSANDLGLISDEFEALNAAELTDIWDKLEAKFAENDAKLEARRRKMRRYITAAVNVSSFCIKWLLAIFYAVAAVAIVYWLIYYSVPTVVAAAKLLYHAVAYVLSLRFTEFAWFVIKTTFAVVFGSLAITASVLLLIRMLASDPVKKALHNASESAGNAIMPPVFAIRNGVGSGFGWIGQTFQAMGEFCAMFYKENCPAITIVSEVDEDIETFSEAD